MQVFKDEQFIFYGYKYRLYNGDKTRVYNKLSYVKIYSRRHNYPRNFWFNDQDSRIRGYGYLVRINI